MREPTPAAQAREMLAILEQAIYFGSLQALLPPDLARAREHLEKLNAEVGTRQFPHQLIFFYRICTLILHQPEPVPMGKFGEALGVPLSTATRIVTWLVKAGYIARAPDPADRRIVRIALTDEGHKLYKMINGYIQHHMEDVLRCFTATERQDLIRLLRKTVTILAKMTP